jgi:hypothetical protein
VTLAEPVPIAMGIARADEPSVLARNFVRTALASETT